MEEPERRGERNRIRELRFVSFEFNLHFGFNFTLLDFFSFSFCLRSEESKPDSDLDEPWIMTVKGLQANSKPSIFSLDDGAFSNGSSNSSSPSRDVNLNHLKIVNPPQRSPSHNQGFSPSSSPTREVPESPTQKSIVHLKEKKEDRYVIESTVEMVKNDEFILKSPEKSPEKFDRPLKQDVSRL